LRPTRCFVIDRKDCGFSQKPARCSVGERQAAAAKHSLFPPACEPPLPSLRVCSRERADSAAFPCNRLLSDCYLVPQQTCCCNLRSLFFTSAHLLLEAATVHCGGPVAIPGCLPRRGFGPARRPAERDFCSSASARRMAAPRSCWRRPRYYIGKIHLHPADRARMASLLASTWKRQQAYQQKVANDNENGASWMVA